MLILKSLFTFVSRVMSLISKYLPFYLLPQSLEELNITSVIDDDAIVHHEL